MGHSAWFSAWVALMLNVILRLFKKNFRDYRFYCLCLALLAMLVVFFKPTIIKPQPVYNFTFVVDITRSMNARDYQLFDESVSRLEYVKHTLQDLVRKLPCQSKVGLGIFTERTSTILFDPVEVCSSYTEIVTTIAEIDWRMAWAADSRISKGLASIVTQLEGKPTHIVFLTDGQEAPPVNPRYKMDFSELKNDIKGLLVGVGGLDNVPIPKYDVSGKQLGVYGPEDVPHRSTFGLPPSSSVPAGNYNARNAPFGGAKVIGDQHLTHVYESYLKQLGSDLDWPYHRLNTTEQLNEVLQQSIFAKQKHVSSDIRFYPAIAALILLCLVYFQRPLTMKKL